MNKSRGRKIESKQASLFKTTRNIMFKVTLSTSNSFQSFNNVSDLSFNLF